ncbi:carboxypeptidase M32 [Pseudoalteromonas obscura]|uniref:Metal-dependent carboxypeptidase n=1 Tax=Pseudoalteromonas obscura TaxID=3048491 RepID=A0ABT7ESD6_9GAMM|nr:carboxypeptidase M32 [Pseudoalteromonas sp. P94(2023)]MDK2597969.1 carboxypeptidase M32 [Pseudoalteromonas sp. P94(2023)]
MATQSYKKLVEHYQSIDNFEHLRAICSWDQATFMPSGGADSRAEAMAELAVHLHKLHTAPHLAELFELAKDENLDTTQQASVKEMHRTWQLQTVLPAELVKAKSLAGAKCEHQWRIQRQENDWHGFLKNFEPVVALSQEEAQIRASSSRMTPYDAMLDIYEPGMCSTQLNQLFGDVATWLPQMIQTAAQDYSPNHTAQYPVEQQELLAHELMALLGFNFNHGRLDTSVHPFCGGTSQDTRITTRYGESEFVNAMMGVIHETGHACYEQNLPQSLAKLPVGKARSMAIHESQSLFYEMQIARSPEFIALLSDRASHYFPKYAAINKTQNLIAQLQRVEPSLIRVDADEVTYPAHVILRYEIERDLINGDIQSKDIPQLWDLKMSQLLGISTKDNYKDGCMQDIHWTDGSFGYFPSYTLGAMYAAQFKHTMAKTINIPQQINSRDLKPIYDWLNTQIWQKASLLSTQDLMVQATGTGLDVSIFKSHLQHRYCKA